MKRTRFAENFSDILRIKGISQSQFARLYGVKQNTISQWANGKREPTFHDLAKICTLFNIGIEEILGVNAHTKKELLRDVIGNNIDFQNEQKRIQDEMFKKGCDGFEISKACNDLYQSKYEEYAALFGFDT